VEEVVIDFRIWAEVEEVIGDGMKTWWYGDITTSNRSVDYLYMLHRVATTCSQVALF
jgi:hypothetical protein